MNLCKYLFKTLGITRENKVFEAEVFYIYIKEKIAALMWKWNVDCKGGAASWTNSWQQTCLINEQKCEQDVRRFKYFSPGTHISTKESHDSVIIISSSTTFTCPTQPHVFIRELTKIQFQHDYSSNYIYIYIYIYIYMYFWEENEIRK